MPAPTFSPQSLEIVSLWEDAVVLHAFQKSLIPADLLRAKQRLAQLSARGRARPSADQPFLFYRMCVILARQNGSATMGELSDALALPLSTATRIVNRLDKGGYVERLTDPADHRIVRIALTREGKKFYRTIHDFARQRVQAALQHFTAQERTELIALLRKVVAVMAYLAP